MKIIERSIEQLILLSRWLLVPIYLALIGALVAFAAKAVQEVVHLLLILQHAEKIDVMLAVLALVDLALVANLIVMIILSGYETFVSRIDLREGQEKPSWLGKVDAGTLKIKLAVAIVAVSSIHLLKAFMDATVPPKDMLWLIITHLTFVVSALLMAVIDKLVFAEHRQH